MVSLRFSIWDSSIHLFQLSSAQFSCKTGNHGTFSLSVYTPCSGCIVSKLGWTHSYNIRSLSHMHGHTLTKFYDCVWWSCSVWPLHVWVKVVHKLEASAPNIPWNKLETSLAVVAWKNHAPWCFHFSLLFLLVFVYVFAGIQEARNVNLSFCRQWSPGVSQAWFRSNGGGGT